MRRPDQGTRSFVAVDFAPPRLSGRRRSVQLAAIGVLLVAIGLAVSQLLLR